ncbi:MAG: metallophosphoesterase, partial [Bdellovibrionota bacterium]
MENIYTSVGNVARSLVRGSLVLAVTGAIFGLPDSASAMGRRKSAVIENPKRARTTDRIVLTESERLLTFLQTNDLHGGVEVGSIHLTQPVDEVLPYGGSSYWSGVVTAIRTGLTKQYGTRAGVALVDGGDQFQGTLISNYNEGKLVIDVMSTIGYQAAVPGNHDYDFGPEGWLVDQVVPGHADQNPRGVFEGLIDRATFPFVSANTYFRDSIYSVDGEKLDVQPSGCRVKKAEAPVGSNPPENPDEEEPKINWSRAKRPDFLIPYKIQFIAGVRVAMIGIDNQSTPDMTTVQNVSDLCFRDEAEAYADVRQSLEGKADVFVLLMHMGDMLEFASGSRIVERIQNEGRSMRVAPERMVDAVFAGHTHMVNHKDVNGVPFIQSGANGELFGRVDLVWDVEKSKIVPEKKRSFAGMKLVYDRCTKASEPFCTEIDTTVLGSVVKRAAFEGEIARSDKKVEKLIAKYRAEVEPLAGRVMGEADGKIWRDRVFESPLSNAMTDALRKLSGAEVAFLNTGGLRAELEVGTVTYES